MFKLIKKLLLVFKNIHFLSLLGNGMMSVFGMVTLAILYRKLSVPDMGVYIFLMAILGLIDTLRAGFLTITFIKFYSGTEKIRAEQVAGACWFIGLAITGISLCVNIPTYFIANLVSDEGLNLFLKYFSIVSVITLPSFMANCVVQADKRFDRLLWLKILTQGSFTLMIFLLAVFGKVTLESVLLVYALSNLLSSLASLLFRWTMIGSVTKADKSTILEMFHFGKYSMGTNISSNLFSVTNTFVINFLIGPAALAIFNLGGKLLQIIEIPMVSFAASGMPILSSHYNRRDKAGMIYTLKKLIGMMTVSIVPLVIIVLIFAEPIIQLVGGKAYGNNEAPNLFRLFMVISLLYPADRFFALGLDVIHQPKINFYKILVMLVVNVVAVLIGITIYHSVYSIAIATIFPTLVAIFMTYAPLNKYYKFSFWSIYVLGYRESILFVKQMKQSLFTKS
jgi:O-antigen/teichoic acid export membrane protein